MIAIWHYIDMTTLWHYIDIKSTGICLKSRYPCENTCPSDFTSPGSGRAAACNYWSSLRSRCVHQVPIMTGWTEAVWNTKFAWHFYTWSAVGIKPLNFWSWVQHPIHLVIPSYMTALWHYLDMVRSWYCLDMTTWWHHQDMNCIMTFPRHGSIVTLPRPDSTVTLPWHDRTVTLTRHDIITLVYLDMTALWHYLDMIALWHCLDMRAI